MLDYTSCELENFIEIGGRYLLGLPIVVTLIIKLQEKYNN